MSGKVLHVMVGLPRSGKSTKAHEMGHPIVNPDSVRLALHGQAFAAAAEKMVWALSHYMVKALFLAGHEHVILDATNTTAKRRADWVSTDWNTHFIVCQADAATCISRAHETQRQDLIPVIERMAGLWQILHEFEFSVMTHAVSSSKDGNSWAGPTEWWVEIDSPLSWR